MRKRRYSVISNFVCPECKNIIPLPRNHGKQRAKGHIKTLYCPYCKADRNFTEIRRKEFYTCMDGSIMYV